MSQYITPAHVARAAGISANMARIYLAPEFQQRVPKRGQQRFDAHRLNDLVAICHAKKQRNCRNRYNSIPLPVSDSSKLLEESNQRHSQ